MATPKLRFKEFDESWSQIILDDLAEVERGKFSVRPRNDPRYFGGKMPFVQTGDVTGSDVYLKGFSQTLNEHGIKVSKVFPENTILITIAANIGDTTITQYPVACPDSVVAIQPKKELTNTIFLKNIIDLQKDFLDSQATQNAQKNINLQVLKPLELIVPKLEEQTKIASFLSAVDEKIAQLTQKHELLSEYKQGMMQKLFSQQIRFKADDGSEFGEWEEKELHQIFQIKAGGDIDRASVSEVRTLEFSYPIFANSDKNKGFYGWANKFKYKEAVTVTGRGNLGIAVARNEPFYPIVRLLVLLPLVKQNLKFFEEQINLLDIVSESTGVPQLTAPQLSKYKVNVPSLEEQTKIANFLSSIDQKIEVVAQQIEQAKQWKKGLLQQMFV
ncbi:restriction endonuclease subunit S [Acinetobacter nosocomialis]|uniref:restriction endonuclease subunit S n=1 Tax=Acinetobacter nosocomialis TaxID=106654 RepID=UPI0034619043